MSKYNTKFVDQEEKGLMEDIDRMDVRSLRSPTKGEQGQLRRAAKKHIERETKMNIRIDPHELDKIKTQAHKEGLRYQTLIKSVLHKYVTGQLVEKGQ
jgi:predicted DNA binding CopG/RHH family protein